MREKLKDKVGGHKQISFRPFKSYSVNKYKKAQGKVTFPSYQNFHNINNEFDFFQKMIEVVNNIAP